MEDKILNLINQTNSLCFWINKNTKLNCNYIFDGDEKSYHVEITNNNNKRLYAYHIDNIFRKSEDMISFELRQLINYLIGIKRERQELIEIESIKKN